MSFHPGQPEVAAVVAIGQLGVIEAHLIQYRRLEAVHVALVFGGPIAMLVRFAVGDARLDASARQPGAIGRGVMPPALLGG